MHLSGCQIDLYTSYRKLRKLMLEQACQGCDMCTVSWALLCSERRRKPLSHLHISHNWRIISWFWTPPQKHKEWKCLKLLFKFGHWNGFGFHATFGRLESFTIHISVTDQTCCMTWHLKTSICTNNYDKWTYHTSVEPVKATLSSLMWEAIAPPAVGPKPGMIFTTPSGKPAWN